ncbi:hypothetical protein SQ11_06295 [Nitrosospira sp. NpAV]|nr:hypothetical protein SQ11_06295 [Nitrosospira sp. NpAV]
MPPPDCFPARYRSIDYPAFALEPATRSYLLSPLSNAISRQKTEQGDEDSIYRFKSLSLPLIRRLHSISALPAKAGIQWRSRHSIAGSDWVAGEARNKEIHGNFFA